VMDMRPTVIGSPGGKLASGLSQADPLVTQTRAVCGIRRVCCRGRDRSSRVWSSDVCEL